MKILLVADSELNKLWGPWSSFVKEQLDGVRLVISAGDLSPYYLEYLVTMLNVPLVYVHGNHDEQYDEKPPEGCIDIDDLVVDICGIRIAGLGGSMKYRDGKYMYTEQEMKRRVRLLRRKLRRLELRDRIRRAAPGEGQELGTAGRIDILLTHAPCRGYGDMEDLPHQGFEAFNELLGEWQPAVHCYGHVHQEYGRFDRVLEHPSGTQLINCSGMYIFEI